MPAAGREPAGSRGDGDADRIALCRRCGRALTAASLQVRRGGDFVHRRRNPYGVEHEFGCFSELAGSREVGPATAEHSWFRGYRWRVSCCAGCAAHVGWRFDCADDRFHGLLLARVRWVDGDRP